MQPSNIIERNSILVKENLRMMGNKRERKEDEEQQSPEENKSCDEGFDTDSGPTQAELDHVQSVSDKVNSTRERNRIHSRQTRLRRKVKSDDLKDKILELSKEVRTAHS
jgi:hypothetical protein